MQINDPLKILRLEWVASRRVGVGIVDVADSRYCYVTLLCTVWAITTIARQIITFGGPRVTCWVVVFKWTGNGQRKTYNSAITMTICFCFRWVLCAEFLLFMRYLPLPTLLKVNLTTLLTIQLFAVFYDPVKYWCALNFVFYSTLWTKFSQHSKWIYRQFG